MRRAAWIAAGAAFAAACAPLFFSPAFSEDERRLRLNSIYGDLSVFFERMLTPKALIEKPASNLLLALLTTAGDYHRWPFLIAGLAAHAACVVLLLRLCRSLGMSGSWAALFFLIHPLALHTIATMFGVTYSVPLALCLYGLSRFIERWQESPRREAIVQLALFSFLLLLKQSFVVYPALLLVLAIHRGGGRRARLAASAAALVAAIFVYLYWERYGQRADRTPLAFAGGQLANLPRLALLYAFPPYYQFEQELNRDPGPLFVVLGALMIIGAAALSIRFRDRPWAIAAVLGVLLLLPTNSFMPREQLVLKWRLYPSLALFSAAAAGALEAHAPRLAKIAAALLLAAALQRDAWLLRSESRYMGSLVRRVPLPSYFAYTCIGLVREEQHERAKLCVESLSAAARRGHAGELAVEHFRESVRLGLLREDAATALSWLEPP